LNIEWRPRYSHLTVKGKVGHRGSSFFILEKSCSPPTLSQKVHLSPQLSNISHIEMVPGSGGGFVMDVVMPMCSGTKVFCSLTGACETACSADLHTVEGVSEYSTCAAIANQGRRRRRCDKSNNAKIGFESRKDNSRTSNYKLQLLN
jgi:hypothetical protein